MISLAGRSFYNSSFLFQVGTLNYMSPEAILGGTNNIRGAPPMKVLDRPAPSALTASISCQRMPFCIYTVAAYQHCVSDAVSAVVSMRTAEACVSCAFHAC